MHQQKGRKFLFYFSLLFLFGSINNIELSKNLIHEIKEVKVIGLGDKNNLNLSDEIKNLDIKNIFFINKEEIFNIINSNNLIEKYEIYKKYPSSLFVNIVKTKFLAKINDNGKIFFIGSNGKLLIENSSHKNLPFIFGSPSIQEFLEIKNTIDDSKFLYKDIKNFYFFPSKRWDLELENNMIIKLPQNNIKETLELVTNFIISTELKEIKIIDARIKNQIILNE